MKKILFFVLFISFIGLLGYKFGFETLFTPGAVKRVRKESLQDIEKSAVEAESRYRKQLESSEKTGNAFEKLGKRYTEHKDWTPAIDSFKKAIEYGSSGARVHFFLGAAYANRGKELAEQSDIKKSEHHYRRAIEINPKLTDAEYGLGILTFYMKKNKGKGISIMKSIAAREPNYYQARFALARFYYENRNPSKSLSVYEDLYSDLNSRPESPKMEQYKKNCKKNISRLMMELSR